MLMDHKVRRLTAPEIKEVARRYREKFFGNTLGPVKVVKAIIKLSQGRDSRGDQLKIEISSLSKLGAPAVVSYNPLKIEFDRKLWTKALLSDDPEANFVAAHELGHIALHNNDAQPYSGVKKKWIDFDEESAEWQANKFADYLLVTDDQIQHTITPELIAAICNVTEEVASRRYFEIAKPAQCCCERCYGTRVFRIISIHSCQECGHKFM